MAAVFAYTLRDGKSIDGTINDVLEMGYTAEDIVKEEFLYNEEEAKLSSKDINELLNH